MTRHQLFLPALTAASLLATLTLAPAPAGALVNGGFEGAAPTLTFPPAVGSWGGDFASKVSAENGISPFEGSAMLRFDGTFWDCPSGGLGSDLHQLVSVDPGQDQSSLSVRVNRVAGGAQTDTEFFVKLSAHSGAPEAFDDNEPATPIALATASNILFSDANLATWEELTVELELPLGTTYLDVVVSAIEDVSNDSTCGIGEFDGHYADAVELTLSSSVPIPSLSPWGLIVLGLMLLTAMFVADRRRLQR